MCWADALIVRSLGDNKVTLRWSAGATGAAEVCDKDVTKPATSLSRGRAEGPAHKWRVRTRPSGFLQLDRTGNKAHHMESDVDMESEADRARRKADRMRRKADEIRRRELTSQRSRRYATAE